MKRCIFYVIFIFNVLNAFAQLEAVTQEGRRVILYPNRTWAYKEDAAFEIPEIRSGEKIIKHTAYSLSWNSASRQAEWIAYQLTADRTKGTVKRTNKFLVDSAVSNGTAQNIDYQHSGYDRGHLVPAADMAWSDKTMKESFYYSNISPQVPAFNRGIWKKLEEKVREWAVENRSLYIVTGPVLKSTSHTIGPNKIPVPKYFYKVIVDNELPEIKGIAFILPNEASSKPLQYYAVSIDSVENLTGINFFPQLFPLQEKLIEGGINLKAWSWERIPEVKKPSK